jgi:hypothetical protein
VPFRVAVIWTVLVPVTAVAVTLKYTDVRLVGTVTDAGTVTLPLFSASVIVTPGAGAARDRVTMQVAVPGVTITGTQLNAWIIVDRGLRFKSALDKIPSRAAVICIVVLAVTAAAAAVKDTDVFPAGTTTDAGRETFPLLSDSDTNRPGEPAARDNVTVQVAFPGVTSVTGVQASECVSGVGAVRIKESPEDTPFCVAVI